MNNGEKVKVDGVIYEISEILENEGLMLKKCNAEELFYAASQKYSEKVAQAIIRALVDVSRGEENWYKIKDIRNAFKAYAETSWSIAKGKKIGGILIDLGFAKRARKGKGGYPCVYVDGTLLKQYANLSALAVPSSIQ